MLDECGVLVGMVGGWIMVEVEGVVWMVAGLFSSSLSRMEGG